MSLTTAEVAARLHLTPEHVRQLAHRGHLQPLRRGARPLQFAEDEVERALQRQWREQRRTSQLGDAWAEYGRVLAGQAGLMSRCEPAQLSPERVEGSAVHTDRVTNPDPADDMTLSQYIEAKLMEGIRNLPGAGGYPILPGDEDAPDPRCALCGVPGSIHTIAACEQKLADWKPTGLRSFGS